MGKLHEEHLEYLNDSLEEIDYGTILITVHDGYITQIDTTEKKRFSKQQANPLRKGRPIKTK